MTEAVPLGELLHEVRKVEVPGGIIPSGLCLFAISRVVWAWPDPLPTRLKRVGNGVQTLWRAELDQLHSMTRAHPPLSLSMVKGQSSPVHSSPVASNIYGPVQSSPVYRLPRSTHRVNSIFPLGVSYVEK